MVKKLTLAVLNELNHCLYTYHGDHYLKSGYKDRENSQTDAAFEYSQRNFNDNDATQLSDHPYSLPSYNGAELVAANPLNHD